VIEATPATLTTHPSRVDYNGRRFRPAPDASGPIETDPAIGHYHQDGDMVWAEFSGAHVRTGRLVGTCAPDGTIEAAYCFVTTAGETVSGSCRSTPDVLANGRVRLTEDWRRHDGSSGVSVLEELAE
jgi:hypothetical protein